jgi:hypothetical protein
MANTIRAFFFCFTWRREGKTLIQALKVNLLDTGFVRMNYE